MLHMVSPVKYPELFEVGKDSSTVFHKKFYDRYREGWPEFEQYYLDYISQYVAPRFPHGFLYQAFPTFRVHLPNNVAVGAFHTDAEFGHPKGEINFIVPLTNSKDTASVWVESAPGKEDYKPLMLKVGQLVSFCGNLLRHGNKVNQTGRTRVSIDFRILPLEMYDENNGGESITQKTKFVIGEYYKLYKHE